MKRLLVHVEGQTEETFVRDMLAPHLQGQGYESVGARLLGNARQRGRRGGVRGWRIVRDDIVRHLRADGRCAATLMVDYYALPSAGANAWPGRASASGLPFPQKVPGICEALSSDVADVMGVGFNRERFVPFVVIHEFEALLFSDCGAFATGIARPALSNAFQGIRDAFETPEHIDDSPSTAPSKRVADLVSGYEKPLMGVLAALEVGLSAMRRECPFFDGWVRRLEDLPQSSGRESSC